MSGFLNRLRAIAEAEVLHLLREPRTLIVVLTQPLILIVLYGYCISFDLHHIPFAVWDQDRSETSRQLVRALRSDNQTFTLRGYASDPHAVDRLVGSGQVLFVLVLPPRLGADMAAGRAIRIQALFDGSDSNTSGVAVGYLQGALTSQNARLALETLERQHGAARTSVDAAHTAGGDTFPTEPIELGWRVFYNPDLSSKRYFIPGLVAVLLTFIAASLTSTTIVRERELGPMESLLTAPVGPVELVLGKLAPYVLVASAIVALVIVAGGLIFGVWSRGSLFDLATFSLLFMLGMLALGMVISSGAQNQQLALMAATFATMLPNIFLTGFAFPRSNMPLFLQLWSNLLPATQFIVAIRGIFLKGVGWSVLWPQGLWMAATTVALLLIAIRVVGHRMARGLE